jgi:hypothetical protein
VSGFRVGAAIALSVLFSSQALAQSAYLPPPPRIPTKDFDIGNVNRAKSSLTPRESGNPLQVRAAAQLVAEYKAPCEVIDAAPLSDRPVKFPSYEVVCKNALGWIINRKPDGQTQLLDCLALDDSARAAGKAWPKGLVCLLPGNMQPLNGLKPIAAKVAPGCDLGDAAYLGAGGEPAIIRYELSCKAGGGYIVDSPAPGSAATLQSMTCAEAAQAGAPCKLTGKAKPSKE